MAPTDTDATHDGSPADDDAVADADAVDTADLTEAAATIAELQHDGTIDDLAQLAQIISLGTAALDDEMVRSLAGTGAALGEVADTAADDDVRDGAVTILESLGAAQRSDPEAVGLIGLMRSLRDPEIQQGLGYLLTLSKALGRARSQMTADE